MHGGTGKSTGSSVRIIIEICERVPVFKLITAYKMHRSVRFDKNFNVCEYLL